MGLLLPLLGWGQVTIAPGGSVTQAFNTIGSTATATLPTGWKADKSATARTVATYAGAGTATEQAAGASLSSTAANGIYNFGSGTTTTGGTDRAIGGLSSGSATKSMNLYVQLTNNGTGSISDFTIAYNVEKYRNGTNAAGYRIQLYYSTDGSTWTAAPATAFTTTFAADADNNGYTTAPTSSTAVSATLTQAVAANGLLYLAWNYSVVSGTTTSSAPALGVDDIVITANGTATPTTPSVGTSANTLNLGSTVSGTASSPQTYNVSGANLTSNIVVTAPSTDVEVSLSSGSGYGSSVSVAYGTGTVANTPIYVRIAAGAAAGTTISGNVTNVSGSASQSVAVSGSVTATATPNPVPTITSLSPATAVAGSGSFTLTVNGTNFVSGSTATFAGTSRAVTYVSATQLSVAVLAADVATAGSYNVAVTNATPGGGTTSATTASTFAVTAAPASSTLLQYSFTGSATTAADAPPASSANVTGGSFTIGTGIGRNATNNVYATTGYSNSATAPNSTEYLQFSITPNATYQASLTTLNYDDQSVVGSGSTLPLRNAQVQYSTSSTFASPVTLSTETITTTLTTHTLALGAVAGLQNVPAGATIYFRIYPYNATNGSAIYTLDNVKLLGTTGPIALTMYYTKPTGDLNTPATFGTNTDGSGTAPTSFTVNSSIFNVSGTSRSFTANWVVSGSGSKVVLTAGASLVVPASFTFAGTLDQLANSTLVLQNATTAAYTGIAQGVQDATSTIDFAQTGTYVLPASSALATQNVRITGGTKTFAKNGGSSGSPITSTVIPGNLTIDNAAGIAGSASTPFTTVELAGNLTLTGTTAFSNANSTRLTLVLTGTGTQTITGNGSTIYLFRLRTGAGNNNVVLAGSTTPVEVGNSTSGGVELFDGSTLALNGNTLSSYVGGKAAFNLETQSDGTFTFSPTSSLLMQSTLSNIGYLYPTPGASTLNNLTITTASGDYVQVVGSDLTVNGALNLTSTTSGLDFTGRTLTLNGTIAGSGVLYGDATSNLAVGGTGALGSLVFASGYQVLNNLTLNRSTSGTAALGSPLTVGNTLTLSNGLLNTTAANLLTLAAAATVAGGSDNSFVNGPLLRPIGPVSSLSAYTFPVGKGAAYRPITLNVSAQSGTTYYRAEQFEGPATPATLANPDPSGTNLVRVSKIRTFTLTPFGSVPNSSPVVTQPSGFVGTVTLSFGPDDFVNTPSDPQLVVAKRSDNTVAWANFGHSASTGPDNGPGGNPVSGTLTSGTINTFSDFTLGSTNPINNLNPLPVRLTSFGAERDGSAVALAWATASEQGSASFVVERSLDGQTFAPVLEVAATGNSTTTHRYAARDLHAPAGALYYRLVQLDLDGSRAYSAVVVVAGTDAARTAYPNPTTDLLTVPGAAGQVVEVTDALGRSVRRATPDANGQLSLGELPTGVYLLRVPGQRVQRIQKN